MDQLPKAFKRRSAAGGVAPLPVPPAWLWKLCFAAALLGGLVWHQIDTRAQAPPAGANFGDEYADCFTGGTNYQRVLAEADTPQVDVRDVVLIDAILEELFYCSLELGQNDIRPIAMGIFGPLLLIMTVWFGVGVMFSGIDPTSVLLFIFRIGFATLLLQNYYWDVETETPFGESRGVVWTIGWQGVSLGRDLIEEARVAIDGQRRLAQERVAQDDRAREAVFIVDPQGEFRPLQSSDDPDAIEDGNEKEQISAFKNFFVSAVENGWYFVLWIVSWITYAQFLWGFVGLSVLGIIGPLMIPFIIVPQLDWLFWSWFKACFQVTIYMMTSAVMYVVTAMVLIVPLAALADERAWREPETITDFFMGLVFLTVPYMPAVFICLAGASKVGLISAAFVSGGLMPGSGLAARAWSAGTSVGTKKGRAALRKGYHEIADPIRDRTRVAYRFQRRRTSAQTRAAVGWNERRQQRQQAKEKLDEHRRRRGPRPDKGGVPE